MVTTVGEARPLLPSIHALPDLCVSVDRHGSKLSFADLGPLRRPPVMQISDRTHEQHYLKKSRKPEAQPSPCPLPFNVVVELIRAEKLKGHTYSAKEMARERFGNLTKKQVRVREFLIKHTYQDTGLVKVRVKKGEPLVTPTAGNLAKAYKLETGNFLDRSDVAKSLNELADMGCIVRRPVAGQEGRPHPARDIAVAGMVPPKVIAERVAKIRADSCSGQHEDIERARSNLRGQAQDDVRFNFKRIRKMWADRPKSVCGRFIKNCRRRHVGDDETPTQVWVNSPHCSEKTIDETTGFDLSLEELPSRRDSQYQMDSTSRINSLQTHSAREPCDNKPVDRGEFEILGNDVPENDALPQSADAHSQLHDEHETAAKKNSEPTGKSPQEISEAHFEEIETDKQIAVQSKPPMQGELIRVERTTASLVGSRESSGRLPSQPPRGPGGRFQYDPAFETFWNSYPPTPHRKDKLKACQTFHLIISGQFEDSNEGSRIKSTAEELIKCALNYAIEREGVPAKEQKYTPNPLNWLQQCKFLQYKECLSVSAVADGIIGNDGPNDFPVRSNFLSPRSRECDDPQLKAVSRLVKTWLARPNRMRREETELAAEELREDLQEFETSVLEKVREAMKQQCDERPSAKCVIDQCRSLASNAEHNARRAEMQNIVDQYSSSVDPCYDLDQLWRNDNFKSWLTEHHPHAKCWRWFIEYGEVIEYSEAVTFPAK